VAWAQIADLYNAADVPEADRIYRQPDG